MCRTALSFSSRCRLAPTRWPDRTATPRPRVSLQQPVARRSRSCGNTQGGNDDEVQPHSRRDGVVGGADSATRDGSLSSSLSASASRAGGAASVRSMAFCSPLSVASARATTVMKRAWISGRIGALGLIRRSASPWPFTRGGRAALLIASRLNLWHDNSSPSALSSDAAPDRLLADPRPAPCQSADRRAWHCACSDDVFGASGCFEKYFPQEPDKVRGRTISSR